MQEIERQLQEIVPKISETNLICGEIGKENFLYQPEIVTQITQEGKRVSRVVVRVYVNKNQKDVYGQLETGDFTDSVYMKIKEIYKMRLTTIQTMILMLKILMIVLLDLTQIQTIQ